MDRIATASRPDVVMIETTPRPTPAPARVNFGQVLADGANGLVQGAEYAASRLIGLPTTAAAVRGGASTLSASVASVGGVAVNATAEGSAALTPATPSVTVGANGVAVGSAPTDATGSIDATLQQSAQMNMYYLHVQQEVDSENRAFTALSNVLKTEHDSAKSAIANIHS